MRFFEGGKALPGVLGGTTTRFDSTATLGLRRELGLAYPPAPSATTLGIECGYTARGAPAGTAVVVVQADAGWELSVHAGGAGSEAPGDGPPATTRSRAGMAGESSRLAPSRSAVRPRRRSPRRQKSVARAPVKPVASGNDGNAKTPAVLSGVAVGPLKARVTAVRLFESGGEVPERKDRVITAVSMRSPPGSSISSWSSSIPAARSIGFEIGCRFDGPDSTARTPTVRGSVDAGWIGSYHTRGGARATAGCGRKGPTRSPARAMERRLLLQNSRWSGDARQWKRWAPR